MDQKILAQLLAVTLNSYIETMVTRQLHFSSGVLITKFDEFTGNFCWKDAGLEFEFFNKMLMNILEFWHLIQL